MNNFTPEDAATLNALLDASTHVYSVSYDPTTVTGTPEADAIALGLTEYYREDSANLVEVIYTGPYINPADIGPEVPLEPALFRDNFTGAAGPLSAHSTDSNHSWVETGGEGYWGEIALLELTGTGAVTGGGGAAVSVSIPITCRIELALLTPTETDYIDVGVNQVYGEGVAGRYVNIVFIEDADPDYVVRSVSISSNDGSVQVLPVDTLMLKSTLVPYTASIIVGESSIAVSIDGVEITSVSGFDPADCSAGETLIFIDTGVRLDKFEIFSD